MKFKTILLVSLIMMLILLPVAHAYTDPGTGMLIWQLLAAAFVGLGFFFRRISFWFKKVLKGKKDEK